MARNEEKQQGRLNRLWLQKERAEGRIKDSHEPRPKLSTLNSASSVKKWIPSIKSEIEHYLQQSQLSHYPERKIAEFQLCIKELENEYKRFITKLRVLDPTCKHQPWTPRAYTRKRADMQDSLATVMVKKPRCGLLDDNSVLRNMTGSCELLSNERGEHGSQPNAKLGTHVLSTNSILQCSEPVCVDQDLPLSFDRTRLSVAVAGFRGPVIQSRASHTQNLARALQSGLPNLSSSPLGQSLRIQGETAETAGAGEMVMEHVNRQRVVIDEQTPSFGSNIESTGRTAEKWWDVGTREERTGHVLGLGCYSSSDEEDSGT